MDETEMMKWIDGASYETLLEKWRYAPVGDPFFRLSVGDYYLKIMLQKRAELGVGEAVAASKRIG